MEKNKPSTPQKNLPAETHGIAEVFSSSVQQFWKPRGDIVVGCWTPKWWNFVVLVAASVGKTTTFSSWWLNHPSPKIWSSK